MDRESFSITRYELAAQVDPEQHRLAVRGTVTLRNDAQVPQKIAVLQVSSSLEWRSLRAGEKIVQFVRQPYASDIDHTGALSEAVVTLPQEIAPGTTIELNIAYEGLILADATRLTRIGTPEDAAKNTDWDQISSSFSAVRGAGYVAWYPIATEVANLSEGDSLFATLARWKRRERGASMELTIENPALVEDQTPLLLVCTGKGSQGDSKQGNSGRCSYDDIAQTPSFALANYSVIDRPSITVFNLPGHNVAAEAYGAAAEKTAPLIAEWFGPSRRKARIADLLDSQSAPFESGPFLFAPLTNADSLRAGLAVAHQLAHGSFDSPRPWISEGLAHFAQALYMEREKGRPAALDYMALHRSLLSEDENPSSRQPADDSRSSLVATADEEFYRSKAMYVWWMLRDLVGDDALKKALAAYRPADDNDPSYMPRLISAQTQRDLGWFFDNWVYRDVGLPEFKVESAFARKVGENEFIVTVTIDNIGSAGAEVPLIVKSARGAVTRRLEVRAKSKAVLRIGTPEAPQEVVVNDGSVPESNVSNNAFKVVMSDLGK
ncbi:MAG TPA: hypothetical protein VKV39_01055 [Candidatus Sulfotelmatobacter sp.]|nr:hypothetical protein [Candidatus Sulfotelmatobacter sp.]